MDPLKLLFVSVVFMVSSFLFYKASGTLKMTKLNMISAIYYYMMVFNYFGGSLVYLGLRKHYLIQKVTTESTFSNTFYAIAYCMIVFPLLLWISKVFCQRLFPKKSIENFIAEPIGYNHDMVRIQRFIVIMILVVVFSTLYVFANLGYIPFIEMIRGGNLDYLRQSGSRFFSGNQYVKNLLMYTLTPFLAYYCYIYYKVSQKSSVWLLFSGGLAILSIIVLTYDFSKAPIITFILGYYLINVSLGNVFNKKSILKVVVFVIVIILFYYVVVADVWNSLFSIYSGPIGRILFTQIATLFLHVQAFPTLHAFLNGASFNSKLSFIFSNAQGVRSGRVVMELYNPTGIETNSAGVMNTLFVGEAYANFGKVGVLIAPILFGLIIGFVAFFLPSMKKRPTTVLLYVQMTLQFITIVEGGFVDIFYSASILFIILVSILFDYIAGYRRPVFPLSKQ